MNTYRIAFVFALALVSLTMGGCIGNRSLAYKSVEILELERYTKELEDRLQALVNDQTRTGLARGEGEQALLGPNATVDWRKGVLYISIENSVLFRPGSNDLNTHAKETLARVIALINQKYAGASVRVEGHTDNQPIKRSKDKWDDNWDLSGGRSMKVLHYLLDHGIPAKQLAFAGYADQRPVDSNSSDAGRSKNRRVEIAVSQGSDIVNEK